MKAFLKLIVTCAVGAVVYLVITDSQKWDATPASDRESVTSGRKSASRAPSAPLLAEDPSRGTPRSSHHGITEAKAAKVPEITVDAARLVVVRGRVVHVSAANGGVALVDCNYDPASVYGAGLVKANDAARSGGRAMGLQVARQMRDKYFGPLVTEGDFVPKERAGGKVALTGWPVSGVGSAVHVVAAPAGTQTDGTQVFTARFRTLGGNWMWSAQRKSALDSKSAASSRGQDGRD